MKPLRAKAKVEYVGKFAEAPGAATPVAPQPATASGSDADAVRKGLGLK
jgi:hypothetical protein